MKNINWNGGARKRLKTLYQENGSFGVFCSGERDMPLQKNFQYIGFFSHNIYFYYFIIKIDKEDELFLRLYLKEERQNIEKKNEKKKSDEKKEITTFMKGPVGSIRGKTSFLNPKKKPFISEFSRKEMKNNNFIE